MTIQRPPLVDILTPLLKQLGYQFVKTDTETLIYRDDGSLAVRATKPRAIN